MIYIATEHSVLTIFGAVLLIGLVWLFSYAGKNPVNPLMTDELTSFSYRYITGL